MCVGHKMLGKIVCKSQKKNFETLSSKLYMDNQ